MLIYWRVTNNMGNSVWRMMGNRITLEHSSKHHFGTQPFWIALEHKMIHFVFPQLTHKHQTYWQAQHFGSLARSNPRFCPYIITSTAMPIPTLWPWNSLCSTTDPLRVDLGGGGRSIPAIDRKTSTYIIMSASFRRLEQMTQPTLRGLTFLLPWPSLCSQQPFRVYLGGGGRSIPAIYGNSHLGLIGGWNFYLHHHFSFLSKVRTNFRQADRDRHNRKGQQVSSQHNWERGRKPGKQHGKQHGQRREASQPQQTHEGGQQKPGLPPTFPVVDDDDDGGGGGDGDDGDGVIDMWSLMVMMIMMIRRVPKRCISALSKAMLFWRSRARTFVE